MLAEPVIQVCLDARLSEPPFISISQIPISVPIETIPNSVTFLEGMEK